MTQTIVEAREKMGAMRVRDLMDALRDFDGDAWICVREGPVLRVVYEPGANEPFVLLESVL